MMVNAHRHAKLLEDFHDAERHYRYYYQLSNRYSVRQRYLRLGLLLATSGTVVTAVQGSEVAALVLGLTTAVMMSLDFAHNYARRAAAAFSIAASCARVTEAYHELWIRVEAGEMDDDRVGEELAELGRELRNVTSHSGYAGLEEESTIRDNAAADADAAMEERMGAGQEGPAAE